MSGDFKSLDKLSMGVQYIQMLIARIGALFLMLSLITATWNLLIQDALFRALPFLEWVWGLAQAVAVDSTLAIVFVRMATAVQNKQWLRSVVYGVVGLLLLFVAVAIIDVESLRQALNITLQAAAGKLPFNITIELLTQVRSVVVGLLIAVSGFELITQSVKESEPVYLQEQPLTGEDGTPEMNGLVHLLPPIARSSKVPSSFQGGSSVALQKFYKERPSATVDEARKETGYSASTISRWKKANSNGVYNGAVAGTVATK